MALRIHFDSDDLANIRFSNRPDPLWEILLSLHLLQSDEGEHLYGRWRQTVKKNLTKTDRQLLELAPPQGYSPDFLTPAESRHGVRAGIQAIIRTPATLLHRDLDELAAERKLPGWIDRLRTRTPDRNLIGSLGDALLRYFQHAVAPVWSPITRAVFEDHESRTRRIVLTGLAEGISDLHPAIRWKPRELVVEDYSVEADRHLQGRGLRIVPSYFCHQHPMALRSPGLHPILVYPAAHSPGGDQQGEHSPRALEDLVGPTRANVLREISHSACSTSVLASRMGLAPSSASEHTRTLRAAGLIVTRRVGRNVVHSVTALGSQLVGRSSPRTALKAST
ncbi:MULTISPECIES: helix-turn-helix domain-containing protein [unclassified Streptomyces]|uniref:ArsR/SmtB family transcription factor n=1 Tax=unclassified Streptomyces TaxID=2593676 RepID=UPI00336A9F8A